MVNGMTEFGVFLFFAGITVGTLIFGAVLVHEPKDRDELEREDGSETDDVGVDAVFSEETSEYSVG
jgi:ligand-binding sensor protein